MADEPFARIRLKATCFGLDAHPTEPLLAAGLISGQLKLFDYEQPSEDPTGGSAKQRWSARPHSGACRAVRFASDGNTVYSTGADGTLQQRDVETNKPTWRRRNAAPATINALALTGETGVATGDDEGMVRCWDMRQRRVAHEFHEHGEYISDMLFTDQRSKHTLLASGGDGYLAVFDVRAGKLWARSDPLDDELLSLCVLKGGKKVLCGTEGGPVGIFSWGDWGDVSDRLLGHPSSVDALVTHDDDHVITGSADGLVRLVGVHPNRVLGVVGDHGDAPVEALAIGSTGEVLASAGHDHTVRLWDLTFLREGEGEEEEGEEEGEEEDDDSDEDDHASQPRSRARSSRAASTVGDGLSSVGSMKRKQMAPPAKPGAAIKLGAGFFADM